MSRHFTEFERKAQEQTTANGSSSPGAQFSCLTAAMVDWRKSCERRFTFNANQAVSDSERAQLRSQYAAKRASLERLLSNGAAEMQRFSKEATGKAAGLKTQSEWAAQKLAQAQTDLSAL